MDALDQNFPTMMGQAIVALANVFVARVLRRRRFLRCFFKRVVQGIVIEPLSRCLPPPHLRNKRLHLLEVLHKARETFERADSTFKATLADEKNNLQLLEVLKQDSECFHSLAREQQVLDSEC